MAAPEDLSDDELLAAMSVTARSELDAVIGEICRAEGVDKPQALFALAAVYGLRAAERDELTAVAFLQVAAAMRRRALTLSDA